MRTLPGFTALFLIILLVGGAFLGLIAEASRDPNSALAAFDGYMLSVARFTLVQAALSTLLSILPAIFVARALFRHPDFPCRRMILRLFALPLALPAIVAAMGILALFGRAGLLAPALSSLSTGAWPGIYGLSGILVAHVFFNLPLATRLFLEALETVPDDQWRLASQLDLKAGATFRLIEWPAVRAALPGVAGLVLMLCITSFTVILTLGGGPAASTLEVSIYQSLRFDFDPGRAVAYTAVQIALTLFMVALLSRLGATMTGEADLAVARRRYLTVGAGERMANSTIIALAALFVLGPIAATAIAGLDADLGRLLAESAFRKAALTSLILALLSAMIAASLAWALAASRYASRGTALAKLFDTGASSVLVVPPIVIGAGWFILLRTSTDVFAIAPVMVVTVNAVMAMPFALRAIRPAHDSAAERHARLAASLGISGWARLRLIDWPVLRRPLATGFAFAMALSLGDLGVIALFGSDAVKTLPYLLYQRMGSYRTADAAGLALLLGLFCLVLILIADWLGRKKSA